MSHIKTIKGIKIISSKKGPKYEIRKEHVEFTDGTTVDRVWCYSFDGRALGGINDAEKYYATPRNTSSPFFGKKPAGKK